MQVILYKKKTNMKLDFFIIILKKKRKKFIYKDIIYYYIQYIYQCIHLLLH